MKVLFVTGSMGRGGAERVISIISNEFARVGWDVSIMQLLYSNCDYPLNANIRLIDVSKAGKNQTLDTPRLIRAVKKEIQESKPDAVISFMMTMNIVTAFACRGTGARFIPSERNDPSKGRSFLRAKLAEHAYVVSYRTVMQTERAKSFFPKKIQEKSVIIPNPVTVQVNAEGTNTNKIVAVGRLTEQKNHSMLIDSFYAVSKEYPGTILEIYGEGPKRNELQEKINGLGLSNRVSLKGNVLDVHERIKDAGLFVLSSNFEGTSNALLEAMMIGLPCISTDCAGSDEVIENGKSGIITPVGDTNSLTKAILKMLSDRKMAEEMARLGKERVSQNYSVDYVSHQWMRVAKGEF
jgi:GalNAc-alpha-(1->4)-GalNAc-alpha-(1->3)-diNAcBac-PP-undecaprenol alpha-1,4-N-acetyl-D-galactosaminyltransferase